MRKIMLRGLTLALLVLLATPTFAGLSPQRLAQLASEEQTLTFVLVDERSSLDGIARNVLALGGRIVVAAGEHILLVHLAPGDDAALRTLPHVQVSTQRLNEANRVKHADPHVALALSYMRWVKSGARRKFYQDGADAKAPAGPPDAIAPPDVPQSKALRVAADSVRALYDNDAMNNVLVSAILAESNGQADLNEFSWTSGDYQLAFGQVCDGLNFWGDHGWPYGKQGYYQVIFYSPFYNTEVNQPYEPIRHPLMSSPGVLGWQLWAGAIMSNMGYNQSDYFDRVRAFNSAQMSRFGTQHAVTIFMAYNRSGPGQFTDGYSAVSYLGGPHLLTPFLPWGDGSLLPATVAHEYAHQFWACDEYSQPGYFVCSCDLCYTFGPHTNLHNDNCEVPSCNAAPADCIMRATSNDNFNNFHVCNTTLRQIGWLP